MTANVVTFFQRALLLVALAALLSLGPGGPLAAGDGQPCADAPPTDALVVGFQAAPPNGEAGLILPAGGVHRGEWVAGERWRELLPKGAKLTVYSLTDGPVGSLHITGLDTNLEPPDFSGWRGTYRITEEADQWHHYVAVWTADGKPVSWVKAKELDPASSHYLKIAREYITADGLLEYLSDHKLPAEKARLIRVDQLLSADLNGDGTDEVLMTAYWSEFNEPDVSDGTVGVFPRIYLLVVRREADREVVVALAGPTPYGDLTEPILGCVDLDRDGRAEVITQPNIAPAAYRIYAWDPAQRLTEYGVILCSQ